ncbi:MFS transporter [Actinophytocola algeriensis]|uniref:MFS family permease n=1 Tax=Actinophytocola algeriensis TaxID=1768010 RepID=A0A7W7PZR0_9PSEU|nr:MFS transporter [Actinophytocola algeriensis]MBB4904325.1 MFS family permease [Actinophytocola algeriensis]MBE1476817.1 MFS family permease [Actinophytocola algeriensis]
MSQQAVNADGTTTNELRRVVAASVVGTALEWYDFFIYGFAVTLVFNELFFVTGDPATGAIVGFATFGVGFAVRPLGGFLFGHLGDRIGRRTTLVLTTLVMGVSTGLIGLLPTYESIGIAAPILLTLLRMCQGLGAGAEFGGASTLLAEHSPPKRRGFFTSFAQTGVQIGLLSGTVVFLLVESLGEDTVLAWAWRIPFWFSFLLIAVALYVRLRVAESPVFTRMAATRETVRLPVFDALRRYPRNFLIGIGAHICDTAVIYIYATYSLTYITKTLDLDRWVGLTGVILFSVVVIALQPVYGALSDRIGRRPLNLFSVVFTAVWAFPFFLLLDTREPVLIWVALIVATSIGFAPMIAVQPSFYAELFGARVRYTGFAASREIGAALGGFSPLIAAALVAQADGEGWLVAVWMIFTAVVSFVAFYLSKEGKDSSMEADVGA